MFDPSRYLQIPRDRGQVKCAGDLAKSKSACLNHESDTRRGSAAVFLRASRLSAGRLAATRRT
jgi:hypothetical protein